MWCWIKSFYFSCKVEPTLGALIWKKKLFCFNYRGLPFNGLFFMSSVGWQCPFCAVFLPLLRDNSAILLPKDCRTQITGSISKFHVFISDQFLQDWIKCSNFSTFCNQEVKHNILKETPSHLFLYILCTKVLCQK